MIVHVKLNCFEFVRIGGCRENLLVCTKDKGCGFLCVVTLIVYKVVQKSQDATQIQSAR